MFKEFSNKSIEKKEKASLKERFLVGTVAVMFVFAMIGHVYSAVTANSPIMAQTPNAGFYQFTNSIAANTYQNVYIAGSNGSKIMGIQVYSNDTVATNVTCQVARSGALVGGATVAVPANSGYVSAILPVNMWLASVWAGLWADSDGNPSKFLPGNSTYNYSIECAYGPSTLVSTSNTVTVEVQGEDF